MAGDHPLQINAIVSQDLAHHLDVGILVAQSESEGSASSFGTTAAMR